MKIASKHFESICKEFARKLYKSMTVDEMNWMFDASGHLSNGLLLDGRMEQLFYELAAPKLRKAASETCFKTLRKQYDVQQSRDHLNTAIDIIEHYLEMQHILQLKELVERRQNAPETILQHEEAFLDAYLGKQSPSEEERLDELADVLDTTREEIQELTDLMDRVSTANERVKQQAKVRRIYDYISNHPKLVWDGLLSVDDIVPISYSPDGDGAYTVVPQKNLRFHSVFLKSPVCFIYITGDQIRIQAHRAFTNV